jgi:hypothetical protein
MEEPTSATPEEDHSKTNKKLRRLKSWKKYAFEFVLLSTAVFMGFLAENFREELTEKQKVASLTKSFYLELLSDSTSLTSSLKDRLKKDTALYFLKNYVLDSSLENISSTYIKNYIIGVHSGPRFQPADVALEQLKGYGAISYFKSMELQELTGNLSISIELIRQRNDLEIDFAKSYLIPFIITYNDQTFFARISSDHGIPFSELTNQEILVQLDKGNSKVPFLINTPSTFPRKDIYNMIWQYRNILQSSNAVYLRYRNHNRRLQELLRKGYPEIDEKGE